MSISNRKRPFSFRMLLWINLGTLLLIIFFGLHFKSFSLSNNVAWIDGQDGIRFGHYGIAYTDTAFPLISSNSESTGLSLELAIRPEDSKDDRFKILLSIHAGNDSEQLLLGQWRSSLIVMNGDDYDGSKRTPKIGVNNALPPQSNAFINITSGTNGTHVYVNGHLRASNGRLMLKIPNDKADAVLVLGNSPYGRHSWTGDIYGLAIYEIILNPQDSASHFDQWSQQHIFSFPRNIDPKIFYTFDDKSGSRAFDHGPKDHHLVIPYRMKILKKEILVAPWNESRLDRQLVQDMLMNLVGFIPPGFFFFALMIHLGDFYEKHGFLLTVCTCFIISFSIELAQAWIPSRSSQSLDLIFNTLGGFVGAIFYQLYQYVLNNPEQ
jgi:VanZ family protein